MCFLLVHAIYVLVMPSMHMPTRRRSRYATPEFRRLLQSFRKRLLDL